ncbi:hypothetical protein SAMN05421858_1526 [Haladaptatus litoreus]|uniref:Uncharacterized protein n=1 Tax=Haladaptatus litoreus TaxID=553468 RepID=A0A1N6YDZ2_9EURY|nr:hypothetical protein [Haladaptatus litoreus]SIR12787.1 hypothetical protein SAMN05421858_1526 [Haladaptatus litoreus]
MIGPFTVGKKAAKFGYKRYGIPGAVVAGGAGTVGYLAVKRAVKSVAKSEDAGTAIDVKTIRSAVEEDGIDAVTDRDTLESAINEEQLDSEIDIEDVQSETENETDELQDGNSESTHESDE